MQIDIFGDGEYVFEQENLPAEITKPCGCEWVKDTPQVGVSYSQTEICADCLALNQQEED